MKRILSLLLFSLLCLGPLSAQEQVRHPLAYNGFSGGMMLHAGWVARGDVQVGLSSPQTIAGVPLGIGGALRVRFGDHLRVGTEGYTSSLGYGDYGSSLSIGWGGLLVDYCFRFGDFMPYAGLTIGGGVVENMTLSSEPEVDWLPEANISFRSYGVGVIVPFVGVEYGLTERMSLTVKADWMMAMGRSYSDFPSGPRCYIGFMFNH
ncbi:MAG: hypothetical protein J6R10_05790 [Tidjanibacter sp.]|nr:hypothetical protein [Tidjanibacter sp.]